MSFNAAELVATIRLDGVQTVARDLDSVRGKLERTDSTASKLGGTARAAFGVAATGVTAVSVATVALTADLFKQGVAYNQLQQNSRAALKTILGGAQQANAQMDRLDAFAKTSPFAKQVFITAQQQLLGFGVEAKKVIPTLAAVQDAVAAVGGSNEQLSQITYALAQMQGMGKLTGQTLNQLGLYGIDAATILGQQMHKTGAEIRAMASSPGGIPVDQIWDPLVTGLQKRFKGAASNVKEQMSGAVDRVRAASRDIGSKLAEPFVSANGGGMAVMWGNQVADVLRAVEGHVQPIVDLLLDRAAPAFGDLTKGLDKARVSIKAWDDSKLSTFLDMLKDNAPAAAGGIALIGSAALKQVPFLGQMLGGLNPVTAALVAMAGASPEVRQSLLDLLDAGKPLIPVTAELASVVSGGLNIALPIAADMIGGVAAVAKPLANIISKIPTPLLATAAAAVVVERAMRAGGPIIQGWVDGVRRLAEQAAVQRALATMEGTTAKLGGTFGVAGKMATGLGNSLKAAFISNPVGIAILAVTTGAAILTSVLAANAERAQQANKRVAEYRETLTEMGDVTSRTSEAIKSNLNEALGDSWGVAKNTTDSLNDLGLSVDGMTEAIIKGGPTLSGMIADLQAVADANDAAQDAALRSAAAQGRDGATTNISTRAKQDSTRAVRDLVTKLEEQRAAVLKAEEQQRLLTDAERSGLAAMTDFERSNNRMNEALKIARDVSKDATERLSGLRQALDELNGGTKTAAEQEKELNDRARTLADAFAVQDEKGQKLAKSLVDQAGKIDTTTAAGSALFDQVKGLNDQMDQAILQADKEAKARGESGISMEDASKKAQTYIDKLQKIAREAGLAQPQIDGLVRSMLDSPDVVAFALTDDGTIDATKLRLAKFVSDLQSIPVGKSVVTDAGTIRQVEDELKSLGYKVTHLKDGTVRVTKNKQAFDSVEAAIEALTRSRDVIVSVTGMFTSGGARNAVQKAAGGPIAGPGTGTSDSIPAWLSNGEHILTAADVRAAGGHAAIMRFREALHSSSAPKFASGGPVGTWALTADMRDWFRDFLRDWNTAQRRGENVAAGTSGNGLSLVDKLLRIAEEVGGKTGQKLRETALGSEKAYLSLQKQVDATDKAMQAAQDRTDARVRAAQDKTDARVDAAQKKLDVAKTSLSDSEGVLSKVASALQSVTDKATQMASSIASAVRRVFDLGKLGEATTTSRTETVVSKQNVGGFELSTSQQVTTEETTPASAASIDTAMAATAARIQRFADRLKKLAKKGYSPALIAEVGSLGVENGEPVADALLEATAAQVASINTSYSAIDSGSAAAGQQVSDLNYKALVEQAQKQVDLAQKAVDKAQAQVDAINKQIDTIKAQGQKTVDKLKAEGQKALNAATARQKSLEGKLASETTRIITSITSALKSGSSATVVKKAAGGAVFGPGTSTSDSIPALLSNGEHVWTADEVQAFGGHGNVARLRREALAGAATISRLTGYAAGGPVSVSSTVQPVREGDVHLHMNVVPQQGEPIPVQMLKGVRRIEQRRKTGR